MADITTVVQRMTMLSKNRMLNGWDAISNLDAVFSTHSQMVIENWYMYYGLHNLFLKKFEAEDDNEFAHRVANSTIENHVKMVINLMSAYLYPKKDSIKRWIKRDGKVDDKLMKFMKENVWNHNRFYGLDYAKGLNAHVTGYTVVGRSLCDIRTMKAFKPYTSAQEKQKYGFVKKDINDSSKAMPVPYVDENGITHDGVLGGIVFYTKSDNFIGMPTLMDLLNRTKKGTEKLEYVDDKVWLRWVRPANSKDWTQVEVNPGTLYVNKNPFGDINIPFTVYKNTGDPFQLIGVSEVDSIKSINLSINNLGSGDESTITYHSYPILMALGGATLPSNFVRTKNASLEASKGEYKYLTWDNKLEASKDRQETLRRVISSVTGISLISRGFLKDIGQIRSGPPLKALFNSDRTTMNTKFACFGDSEIDEMRADILYFDKSTEQIDEKLDKTITFHVEFDEDFLQIDELLNAEINQIKVAYGETLKEVLIDEHPDWSEEKINQMVKEKEDAKLKEAENQAKVKQQSFTKKSQQQQ